LSVKTGETPGFATLTMLLIKVIGFLLITTIIGQFILPTLNKILVKFKTEGFVFSTLLIAALSFALLAEFLGKLLGAGLPASTVGCTPRQSFGIGTAMSARGAVELIIAGIAMEAGLFNHPSPPPPVIVYLFSAVVIMALLTTLITPIIIRPLLGKKKKQQIKTTNKESYSGSSVH